MVTASTFFIRNRVLRPPIISKRHNRASWNRLIDANPFGRSLNQIIDHRILIGRIAADADTDDRNVHVAAVKSRNQTGMSSRAAGRHHNTIYTKSLLEQLALYLLGTGDIAGRPYGI